MRLLLPLLLLFALTSCQPYYSYTPPERLTAVPLPPTLSSDIQLYFGWDTPPDKAYIRVAMLQARKNMGNTGSSGSTNSSPTALLNRLKQDAAKLGAHGILIVDSDNTPSISGNDGIISSRVESTISGLAIAFVDQLRVAKPTLDNATIIWYDNNAPEQTASIPFNQLEEAFDLGSDMAASRVYQMSLQYLLHEKTNWEWKRKKDINGLYPGGIIERRNRNDDLLETVLEINYLGNGTIANIVLRHWNQQREHVLITPSYDDVGRMVSRRMGTNIFGLVEVDMTYNTENLLSKELYYNVDEDEKRKLAFTIDYNYTSKQSDTDWLVKEQVIYPSDK